jgi:hypothetical protein
MIQHAGAFLNTEGDVVVDTGVTLSLIRAGLVYKAKAPGTLTGALNQPSQVAFEAEILALSRAVPPRYTVVPNYIVLARCIANLQWAQQEVDPDPTPPAGKSPAAPPTTVVSNERQPQTQAD